MNVRHHDDDGPNAGPPAYIEQRGSHDAPHDQWRCTTAGEFRESIYCPLDSFSLIDWFYLINCQLRKIRSHNLLILKTRNIPPSYNSFFAKDL